MNELKIGRAKGNEIEIDDPSVSRHHALLIITGQTFSIVDLGSTNGTFINGRRVAGNSPLQLNDILKVGNSIVPWRNYVGGNFTTPNPVNVSRRKSTPIESITAPADPQPQRNMGPVMWSIMLGVAVVAVGLYFMMGNPSDESRLAGTWNCTTGCDAITEIVLEDNTGEDNFIWTVYGDKENGTWLLEESGHYILFTSENEADGNFRYRYDLDGDELKLVLVEDDGSESGTEFTLHRDI